MANVLDTSWHTVSDTPYDYKAKIGDLTLIYLKTSQYNRLKAAGKLVPNALYMTPDDNDSTGGFLSREDIENVYTTHTDKVPSSLLVRLLLERIKRLEQIIGVTPTVGHSLSELPETSSDSVSVYYPKDPTDPSFPDPDRWPDISELLGKNLIKTETP